MGTLKKMKKEKKASSPLDPGLMLAFNRGYEAGTKEQRQSDIKNLASMLEGLEELPGIGEKTAWKIRKLFLSRFMDS